MSARRSSAGGWRLAARLARREIRSGLAGFRIFLACLVLGVAAIATVQSLSGAVLRGLEEDGQSILGGDIVFRTVFQPAPEEARRTAVALAAAMSETAEMRAMARTADGDTTLVELKAVDDAYPLYGEVVLAGGGTLAEALALRDGIWGAVVEETLATRLGLAPGDRFGLGAAEVELRDLIVGEPDRAAGGFALGPRVMLARAALPDTGLAVTGSLIDWDLRLRLPPGVGPAEALAAMEAAVPDAHWRVRDRSNAAPSLRRTIDRLTMFLTLTGLTALLVGGVGVGNATRAHLEARIPTIATLKTLGAPSGLVFRIYLVQMMAIAALGTAIGLVIGAAVPVLLADLLAEVLPIPVDPGIFPARLAIAAVFGLLTALAFTLWPLFRARAVPAAALFRDRVVPATIRGGWRAWLPVTVALAALALLAILTSSDRGLAAGFVAGAAAAVVLFRAAALALVAAARAAGRLPALRRPTLRLAIASLYRPGAPTAQIVLSLGLGLTVLVAIGQIEGTLRHEIERTLPQEAPSFFFVDIQNSQKPAFDALIAATPGGEIVDAVPSLRGRIVAVDGVPADQAVVDPDYAWINNGDRGVTYAAEPAPGTTILAGAWWPPDHDGPPLVSIAEEVALAYGIGPGAVLTVAVLGRDLDFEVANVRAVDWGSLNVNFTLVTTPQPLASAPHTWLATARVPEAGELALQRAVGEALPNVTTVRLKEALETLNRIVGQVATAIRATAGVTLLAGGLVLAGVVAAGHRRRVYEAVVLKVLGATRRRVLAAFLTEYGLLGLTTAVVAAAIGTAAAWAVLSFVMRIGFIFDAAALAMTMLLCLAATIGFGFVGTWLALGQKAAPLLRNE